MKTNVLVVLVNYKNYQDTQSCINSIKDSSLVKILLIDQNSIDRELKNIQRKNPSLLIKKLKENRGFAAANNIGLKLALKEKIPYVLLLNNDTVVEKNTIKLLFDFMEAHPDCAICSPVNYFYNKKNKICFSGGKINFYTGQTDHFYDLPAKDRKTQFITGASMFIRTRAFKDIGFMNEKYFLYYEDADLSVRIRKAGWQMWIVKNAKIWHKVSVSLGGHGSKTQYYYGYRNRLFFIKNQGTFLQKITVKCWSLLQLCWLFLTIFNFKNCTYKINRVNYALRGIVDYFKGYCGELK